MDESSFSMLVSLRTRKAFDKIKKLLCYLQFIFYELLYRKLLLNSPRRWQALNFRKILLSVVVNLSEFGE